MRNDGRPHLATSYMCPLNNNPQPLGLGSRGHSRSRSPLAVRDPDPHVRLLEKLEFGGKGLGLERGMDAMFRSARQGREVVCHFDRWFRPLSFGAGFLVTLGWVVFCFFASGGFVACAARRREFRNAINKIQFNSIGLQPHK